MSQLDMTPAFSDVEAGLQTWLKAQPPVSALVAKRVFLGMPRKGPSTYPCIALWRLSGGPEEGDYPVDGATMQFDCWGNVGDKLRTFAVAKALVSSLLLMRSGTLLSETVRGLGAYGINISYQPDPGTGQSRYVVDCKVQAQAV